MPTPAPRLPHYRSPRTIAPFTSGLYHQPLPTRYLYQQGTSRSRESRRAAVGTSGLRMTQHRTLANTTADAPLLAVTMPCRRQEAADSVVAARRAAEVPTKRCRVGRTEAGCAEQTRRRPGRRDVALLEGKNLEV